MATGAAYNIEVVLQPAPLQYFSHSHQKITLAWWGTRLQCPFFTQADVSCTAGTDCAPPASPSAALAVLQCERHVTQLSVACQMI